PRLLRAAGGELSPALLRRPRPAGRAAVARRRLPGAAHLRRRRPVRRHVLLHLQRLRDAPARLSRTRRPPFHRRARPGGGARRPAHLGGGAGAGRSAVGARISRGVGGVMDPLAYWDREDVESMYDKHLLGAELALIAPRIPTGSLVLDAGCGEGEGTARYREIAGARLHAVDF